MSKRKIVSLAIGGALIVSPALAFAQTTSGDQAQISALLAQVQMLQAYLAQLKSQSVQQTSAPQATVQTATAVCINLTRAMGPDDTDATTNGEVSILQRFLAADSSLYPEGRITGYFGPATTRAVQRYRTRNGIVSSGSPATTSYGFIGPRTRASLVARCKTTTPPIVRSSTTPPLVKSCLEFQVPVCASGQHVQRGATDANGCQAAPKCVNDTTVQSCPVYSGCPSGYTDNKSVDANGCTVLQCVPPPTSNTLTASPTSGAAPLAVSFSGAVNSEGYSIDFGDGTSSGDIGCAHGACPLRPTLSLTNVNAAHTYTSAGTYVAKLRRHFATNAGNCAGADCNVVGTARITVIPSQSCPQYQAPACSTGQHVEQGPTDSRGCAGAPMCVNDTVSAPSIRVTSPSVGHLFSVGETISIAWNSTAAPSNAVVQLDLIDDSTGELVGDGYMCSANGTSGSCSWRIPLSAEICGRSTDIPGICGTDFKSTAGYKVRASLLSALMCRGFCQPNAGQPAIYAKGESGVFGIKGLSTEAQKAALSITANNATASLSVTSGTAITIRWYATYVKAGSCVLLGNGNLTGWTGEASPNYPSGGISSGAISTNTTYTLSCKAPDNTPVFASVVISPTN